MHSVYERMLRIRLAEEVRRDPGFAREAGIAVVEPEKNNPKDAIPARADTECRRVGR